MTGTLPRIVSQLRCGVLPKGRREHRACQQLLIELGRASDGELAAHAWGIRGARVNAQDALAQGARIERLTAGRLPAEVYAQWLAEHDGEQPAKRLDFEWLRLDDWVFDEGLTGIAAVCTEHGPVLMHRDFLRAVAESQRRSLLIDVRQRRVGYVEE